jgi:hypothetical protein
MEVKSILISISLEEMISQYPDQWLVVGDPKFDGLKLVSGIIIANHIDKRVASIIGGEMRKDYSKVTVIHTGISTKKSHHIGLLKSVK